MRLFGGVLKMFSWSRQCFNHVPFCSVLRRIQVFFRTRPVCNESVDRNKHSGTSYTDMKFNLKIVINSQKHNKRDIIIKSNKSKFFARERMLEAKIKKCIET